MLEIIGKSRQYPNFLLVSLQDFAASDIDVTKTNSIESTRTKMTMLSTAIQSSNYVSYKN